MPHPCYRHETWVLPFGRGHRCHSHSRRRRRYHPPQTKVPIHFPTQILTRNEKKYSKMSANAKSEKKIPNFIRSNPSPAIQVNREFEILTTRCREGGGPTGFHHRIDFFRHPVCDYLRMNARRSFRMIEFITPDCKIVQSSSRIKDEERTATRIHWSLLAFGLLLRHLANNMSRKDYE